MTGTVTVVNCAYCGDPLGALCVEGGFCSEKCRAMAEHVQKLREHEVLNIRMQEMDDGSCSVQIALRVSGTVREMARTYESPLEAFRGIAELCTRTADQMEAARG